MFEPVKEPDYFQDLIDDAKNNAVDRGEKTPNWNDVWSALLKNRKLVDVLRDRRVSTHSVYTELQFLQTFRKDASLENSDSQKLAIAEAAQNMLDSLEEAEEIKNRFSQSEITEAIGAINSLFISSITKEFFFASENENAEDLLKIRHQLLQHVSKNVSKRITAQMIMAMGADAPDAEQINDIFSRQFADIVYQVLSDAPYSYLEEEPPIQQIEALKTNPIERPSPVELVDFIIENSGSHYEDLLYRNGLLTDDPEREDSLKDTLPSYTVQQLALAAYNEAQSLNSITLTNRHLAMTMLNSNVIRTHLSKLGINDLLKFEEDFRKLSYDMEKKPDGKVSVRTKVSDEMRDQLDQLDKIFKKTPNEAELLLWLMKQDEAIDKALNKSGLRRRMKQDWRSQYDKKLEDEKDPSEQEKKKEEFQISDEHLEELIAEYCIDYTKQASQKKIHSAIGREDVMDIISTKILKKGKKNPIIIGEAGIGKTAIMEGFAVSMVKGDVPEDFVGGRLLGLDLAQMDDSMFKGVFESRVLPILKGISERNAKGDRPKIIIGLDEFAVTQNAGTHSGDPNGFRGLIKPYLTSGDLITLPATTEKEYREQIEKDSALARRLQPVYVSPPSDEETTEILKGIKLRYSKHHKIRIPERLLTVVSKLSGQYIHNTNQPDKSIDILDEACALAQKKGAKTLGVDHIHEAIHAQSNIPLSFFSESEDKRYLNLDKNIKGRVFGQDEAIDTVCDAIKLSKSGLGDPNTPVGNFLFVGPTGVGKTELSKAIAAFAMGSEEDFMIRFDMSEFMERTSVGRFIGTNVGMAGYEEGGALVKAVRSKPYSVVLLDEIEKAHPDVFNPLLRGYAEGVLTDGRGIKGNMTQCVNIMTSNLGAVEVLRRGQELGLDPIKDYEAWQKMARPIYMEAVHSFFKPEFINRLDGIICFDSLGPDQMQKLVKVQFNKTAARVKDNYGLDLQASPSFMRAVAKEGYNPVMGARPLERAWKDMAQTPLADTLLSVGRNKIKQSKTVYIDAPKKGSTATSSLDAVFNELLEKHSDDLTKVADEYAKVQNAIIGKPVIALR